MLKWFKKPAANTASTSIDTIISQMNEPRPLPMGRKEFDQWINRILSGSLLPCTDRESMEFALATMLMHLGPQESHKPDAFFIHSLRKSAVNQVAHARMQEIKTQAEGRLKDELAREILTKHRYAVRVDNDKPGLSFDIQGERAYIDDITLKKTALPDGRKLFFDDADLILANAYLKWEKKAALEPKGTEQ